MEVRTKRELEIVLQQLEGYRNPKPELEQCPTPASLAAAMIHMSRMFGDLEGRRVADLGCGNGVLAIGSVLYGASEAVGIDIDPEAVEIARMNAERLGLSGRVRFLVMDVRDFSERVDTVVQNPPFGTRRRHMDTLFLEVALRNSKVTYSLHMAGNSEFLRRFALERGASLTHVERWPFPLERVFPYHRRRVVRIPVELLRFEVMRHEG
ncbi:MAG: methyltransferase domain-containing protein [Candidatus Korarchaeota archaeon NZ13-K]|nr:MAG: methyltransferase domain-containing protein [Candidatus Korarchaeota archaeon NZ13-K]